jgi:acyl-CoA synthetase (AMP-forming)/AMP-acid ligase II
MNPGFDPTANALNVMEILRSRAGIQPTQLAYTFLDDGINESGRFTYAELDARASDIAAHLSKHAKPGDRALLLYPQSLEFIASFLGCLYAGIIAIPAYPPRPNRGGLRIHAIAADAQPVLALTTADLLERSRSLFSQADHPIEPSWIATDTIARGGGSEWQLPVTEAGQTAYLQYTSGSTSTPKGVMVTHGNLMHNLLDLDQGWKHSTESVTWLPTFHDMGLVYGVLEPLYRGFPCFMMPPLAFLQRPARWLQAISDRKATHSVGPNFAYDLCVRKIKPAEREKLNLSHWNTAVNGAEPVRRETLDRFTEMFAPVGFRPETFCPGYGLAENTLKATATRAGDLPKFYTASADAGEPTFVGCGVGEAGTRVEIVNYETGTRCAPNEVGEIWIAGPSVTAGYWNRPEETAATFGAKLAGEEPTRFLRTGDLGFFADGALYVTGRIKDLIIIRGQNHYPQDIELTVERSHAALRPGCGAAFAVDIESEERLVIAQEIESSAAAGIDTEDLVETIRQNVSETHDIQVYSVVFLRAGEMPKTSSGKLQRRACRAAYLSGTLRLWSKQSAGEPALTES